MLVHNMSPVLQIGCEKTRGAPYSTEPGQDHLLSALFWGLGVQPE